MSRLKHGFKARAERLAVEVRAELGLDAISPLDPADLAELYGIPVLGTASLDAPEQAVEYFTGEREDEFSALTVFNGTRRLIVLNDRHSDGRLANSLAHELAHLLLEHDPKPVVHSDGSRTWSDVAEAQADELGAQLLLPRETAKQLAFDGIEAEVVADRYGVSVAFARWRLSVSGGYQIRRRLRSRRGS